MKNLEDREQMAVIQWAELVMIPKTNEKIINYLIAIPNGGIRSPMVGAKYKKLGMKKGVSDLFLAYPVVGMHGLWIEMKKRRKDFSSPHVAGMAATDDQLIWLAKMEEVGYMGEVCYGADEAITKIKTYLGIQ